MNNAKVAVVLTLWGLLFMTHVQGDNADSSCRKFDGAPSDCVPIQNCASLYALAVDPKTPQKDIDLLRSRQCGALNGVNYVCCPKPKSPPDNTDSSCRKFDGTPSDCVPIQNCASLYALAVDPKTPQKDIDLLRSRQCGAANGVNYVCCPKPKSPPDSSCQTPDDKPGTCKPVQECITLLDLVNKQLRTPEETSYLQKSQCGYVNGIPKVCCPIEPVVQPGVRAITTDNTDSSCRKFDGTPENCVPLQNCASLYALATDPNRKQIDIDLLRSRQCNFFNGVNYVCCPKPKPPPKIVDSFEKCVTTTLKNGECMTQQSCINMLKIEQNPQMLEGFAAYAQLNGCGYASQMPLVCCPKIESPAEPALAETTTVTAEALPPPPCRTSNGTPGECTPAQNCKSKGEGVCDTSNPNEPKVCCPKALKETADEPKPEPIAPVIIRTCKTPNGAAGKCVSLEQCHSLINILKKNEFLEYDAKYLNASFCEDADELPVVCCPDMPAETILPLPPYCGRVSTENNTDNSTIATELDEYPWTALLISTNDEGTETFICGGTLIHERYVLTAAHCQEDSSKKLTSVRLGEWGTLEDRDCQSKNNEIKWCATPHIDIAVESIIVHPEYSDEQNDIALIRLAEVVQSTRFISPICLPFGTDHLPLTLEGTTMPMAGWSATTSDKIRSFKTKSTFTVRNFTACVDQYLNEEAIMTEAHFCASGDSAADTTILDSGGALMALQKIGKLQSYILVGIECLTFEDSDIPGMFTQIGTYLEWLKKEIQSN